MAKAWKSATDFFGQPAADPPLVDFAKEPHKTQATHEAMKRHRSKAGPHSLDQVLVRMPRRVEPDCLTCDALVLRFGACGGLDLARTPRRDDGERPLCHRFWPNARLHGQPHIETLDPNRILTHLRSGGRGAKTCTNGKAGINSNTKPPSSSPNQVSAPRPSVASDGNGEQARPLNVRAQVAALNRTIGGRP